MDDNNVQPNNANKNLKTLRTYSSDMADAIRDNEMSVIKIALAEKEKKEREFVYKKVEGTNLQKILLIAGGVILIIGAIVGVYSLMRKNSANNTLTQQTPTNNMRAFISYNSQSSVDATGATDIDSISKLLRAEISSGGNSRSIKAIFVNTTVGTASEPLALIDFLSEIKTTAPGALVRSLTGQYMIGTYQSTNSTQAPHLFFIFQTKDYNQAYPGMLAWEQTILGDLYPLFGIDVSADESALLQKQFKDIIIANKDARVLYDFDGKSILYYIFANKNDFIITDSTEAIGEILSRLQAKNAQGL